MDSGNFFWQTNGTENETMQTGTTNTNFIQQVTGTTSQQQEVPFL